MQLEVIVISPRQPFELSAPPHLLAMLALLALLWSTVQTVNARGAERLCTNVTFESSAYMPAPSGFLCLMLLVIAVGLSLRITFRSDYFLAMSTCTHVRRIDSLLSRRCQKRKQSRVVHWSMMCLVAGLLPTTLTMGVPPLLLFVFLLRLFLLLRRLLLSRIVCACANTLKCEMQELALALFGVVTLFALALLMFPLLLVVLCFLFSNVSIVQDRIAKGAHVHGVGMVRHGWTQICAVRLVFVALWMSLPRAYECYCCMLHDSKFGNWSSLEAVLASPALFAHSSCRIGGH